MGPVVERSGKRGSLIPAPLRWLLVLLFCGATALTLYTFSGATGEAFYYEQAYLLERLRPQLVTKNPAPDFELRGRDGKNLRLSSLRGRPVVLNFWSITCPPCLEELPALIELSKRGHQQDSFSVVTVCVEGSWDEIRESLPDSVPESFVVLFDPERSVVQGRYGTERFPETFLIDSGGNIRARFDGQRNWTSPFVLNLLESF